MYGMAAWVCSLTPLVHPWRCNGTLLNNSSTESSGYMKKLLLAGLLLIIVSLIFYSCSTMSVGMGFGISTGPYGPVVAPSFNVGFGGGFYW
jgi:hypothetical protein